MAWKVRVTADIDWVGEGMGGAGLGILASNNPGFGTLGTGAGAVGCAQTLRLQQADQIIATAAPPTLQNFKDALTTSATDLGSQITATVLAQLQGWSTGGV